MFFVGVNVMGYVMCSSVFFFFKQKTAYEMRISDWSSDVCSSDLLKIAADYPVIQVFLPFNHGKLHFRRSVDRLAVADDVDEIYRDILDPGIEAHRNPSALRSEEHTSELQSLMRISYAVFCLKKKTTILNN